MPDGAKPKKLSEQEKERIFFLANQGQPTVAIAKEMGISGQRVNGFIQSLINTGKMARPPKGPAAVPPPPLPHLELPPETAPMDSLPLTQEAPALLDTPTPPETLSMPTPQVPQQPQAPLPPRATVGPSAPRMAAPQAPISASYNDGFSNGQITAGYNSGWNNPNQIIRYQVERVVPNDGIMGFHSAPFTQQDLSTIYGEGMYRILKQEPGRPAPFEYNVKVGPGFGAPRYPKQGLSSGERPPNRWGQQSQSWRDRDRQEEDSQERYPRPERPAERESLYAYQRQAPPQPPAQDNSVANLALHGMMELNKRTLEQAERQREHGPESFITNMMREQQELQNTRWAEERRREEIKQKDENERWERRQKEREDEHRRELDRIRMEGDAKAKTIAEERKMIMDLEDKKIQIVREEHKIRQDQLQAELSLSREQSKNIETRLLQELAAVKDKTEKEIEQATVSLKEDADREKSMIDREFDLRKTGLEKEQQLQEKILEIRGEQLQQQGGNEVFNTINTLIKEFSKGLEKVVELKKTQSLSSEAQVAQIAAGASQTSEGNVSPEASPESPKAGDGKPAANGAGGATMEKLIQDMMDEPFFREVMKEWALHVESEADPTTFANMYLEWMRDPQRAEARQACSMFASVMKVRSWKKMLAVLAPKLSAEVMEQFQKPYATDFYDGFKAMVMEQIRVYWESFLAEQQAANAAQKAGVKPSVQKPKQQEAPAAAAPAPAAQEEVEGEEEAPSAPPVPTRESLRKMA